MSSLCRSMQITGVGTPARAVRRTGTCLSSCRFTAPRTTPWRAAVCESQASARHLSPFIVEPDLPEGAAAMLERTEAGECVFLERGTKLCIVHRDIGESALPATCRSLSPTGGSRRPWHVHHAVALLSDSGIDAVPRRLPLAIVARTTRVSAWRVRRACRHRQRFAAAPHPDDAHGFAWVFGVGTAHGCALLGGQQRRKTWWRHFSVTRDCCARGSPAW